MLIFIAVYMLFLLFSLSFSNVRILKLIIFICFFQNLILVALSRYVSSAEFNILALSKDVYVMLFLAKLILWNKKLPSDVIFCIFAMGLLAGMMFAFGSGELKGRLSCFRQLILPFMFYAVGRLCNLSAGQLSKLIRFFINITIVAIVFGFIEYAFGERLWVPLGLTEYAQHKDVTEHLLSNNLLRSFYTYLTPTIRLRRMASVLVDPVILSQLIAFAVIACLFCKDLYKTKGEKAFSAFILILGLVLSNGKGGIVIALLSFCILLRQSTNSKILSRMLLLSIVCIIIYYFTYQMREDLSGSAHYNGLVYGFQSLITKPLGTGIGSEGNLAYLHSGLGYAQSGAGESYIGSMIAQTGIVGLIINCIVFHYCLTKKNFNKDIDINECNVFRILTMTMVLTSFVNYTSISFTSCYIYFILSGLTKGEHSRLRKERTYIPMPMPVHDDTFPALPSPRIPRLPRSIQSLQQGSSEGASEGSSEEHGGTAKQS